MLHVMMLFLAVVGPTLLIIVSLMGRRFVPYPVEAIDGSGEQRICRESEQLESAECDPRWWKHLCCCR